MLLKKLLAKGETALTATNTLISLGILPSLLDCTDVETLTETELNALFGSIPPLWEWENLAKFIEVSTLNPALMQQLQAWIDRRLGRDIEVESQETAELTSKSFDIFSFRDEIIEDYRNYIASFLKI
ncbi:hypothetical protein [Aphanothece hegewaldii]|uniref:hypothetical protein n=1 Tax=Aphanothece hegewaldii TaxID=1521625 RepID=UPI001FEBBF12|nr:hypothetical protein [Aphanothece hegewaldii]